MNFEPIDRKAILRQEIQYLKAQSSDAEKSSKSLLVWQQIEAMEHFRKAKTVLMYWSMPSEVQTHDFILYWYKKKTIILPVVDGDTLRLKLFEGKHLLQRHANMNLYEPQGEDYSTPQTIELAIIPGIAFDRYNHRLGRGKGYYDKLLPHLNAYKIGVGFDFQLLDNIPTNDYDVPMDKIIVG